MSPRKLRKTHSMDQCRITRSRVKANNHIIKDAKTLQYSKENLNSQEEDQTDVSIISGSPQKNKKTWHTRLSKKEMHSQKRKKHSSNKNVSEKNLHMKNMKLDKNVSYNDSLIDIDNVSHELLQESPMQFKNISTRHDKAECFKKSPEQSFTNTNIKDERKHNKSPNGTITPKSSPVLVTLTPLRTTKTPKRSPLNIASPKTYSKVPFKLLKTPKKLNLSVNSTIMLTNSDKSLRSRKNINNDIENSTFDNNLKSCLSTKSKKLKTNRLSEDLKFTPRRSSKSPKNILKFIKLKSKHGRSKSVIEKERSFSTSKPKSLNKSISTKVITSPNKITNDHNSLSSPESDLELTLTNKKDVSVQYKEIISKMPIVRLERIPLLDALSESLKTRNNQYPIDITLGIQRYIQKQLFTDVSSPKHSISHINQEYPMKTEEKILKNLNDKKKKRSDNTNFIVSSTPKIRFKTNLDDTILFNPLVKATSSPISDKRVHNSSPFRPASSAEKEIKNISVVDDIQNFSYVENETDDNRNNTIIIENEKTVLADETYDLFEPTTPHLQRQHRKLMMSEVDADDKEEIKKTCKVRFTSASFKQHYENKLQTNDKITIRKTPIIKNVPPKRSSSVSNTSARKSKTNYEFRRRSNSMSNIKTTPYKKNKNIEKTPSNASNKKNPETENQGNEGIKKQSTKTKIPNFSKIHKHMFVKMESLVDNKIRLMQRHEALKTSKGSKVDNTKKLISPETRNRKYNKFGFKLNKDVATNIVLRKQTNVQKETREENKAFLKGVRTNRRFELQMKMRKING